MGTRADIYAGRGKTAEWIGSFCFDGYPEGVKSPEYPSGRKMLMATTEADFRTSAEAFFQEKGDHQVTRPIDGWPWPWNDSRTTDYAYAFDGGKVWASCFGNPWFDPLKAEPDSEELEDEAEVEFPDMTERKNVTFGRRSGLIVAIQESEE